MQLCPTCGGVGEVAEGLTPLREFHGHRLGPKLGLLLALLLQHEGRFVSHQSIIVTLWNGSEPEDVSNSAKVNIYRLRSLLRPLGYEIEVQYCTGYRLKAPRVQPVPPAVRI